MDYRIAAEILLRTLDDLDRADLTTPPLRRGRMARVELDDRLQPDHERLENELTERGLFPAPSLLLVIEGETESLLIPRVLDEVYGNPVPRSLVQIIDMKGIDRDLDLLVRREVAPWIGEDRGDYVLLSRPPTRVLVAVDPEKGYATPRLREEKREGLVRRIVESLDSNYRTESVRRDLDGLVEITAWGKYPWEFANFNLTEIAKGIEKCVKVPAGISRKDIIASLKAERSVTGRSPNVANVCKPWRHQLSKPDLAEALWPLLRNRIAREMTEGPPFRTPALRVGVRALELALSAHRRSVALPVK
jgi:hypothetical protein